MPVSGEHIKNWTCETVPIHKNLPKTGILAFAIIDLFSAKSWKCLDVLYAQLGASKLFEFGGVAPR